MVSETSKKQSMGGEIRYRKKLVRQQILGQERHFEDHKSSLDEVYESWMKPQIEKLDELMKEAYKLGKPTFFLELGSENSHLGLHLMSRHGLNGVCVDLSLDTLRLGVPKVAEKMKAHEKPYFVVADVHNLPFHTESFNFIFCFGSIHHFYDMHGAIKEIRRVCSKGGVFLTSYDPIKPFLKPTKKESCSEVSYGILENSYTLWGYARPLKKFFAEVNVIHSESSQELDLYALHRIKRLKEISKIQGLIPKKMALLLRLLWFGVDDFTSISVA